MSIEMKQQEALEFYSEFYGGDHRVPKMKEWGGGWMVIHHSSNLSTYDFTGLTRLVFMAHRDAIRVAIEPCTPQSVRIILHKRDKASANISLGHPSLKEAVQNFNGHAKTRIEL